MHADIRKIVTSVDRCEREASQRLTEPWIRVSCAAVLANPWHGAGYVADLSSEVARVAPVLARELSMRVLEALGGRDAAEAFGKGVLVGTDGEIEHGAALIHNPHFGDGVRHFFAGTSLLPFSETRADAGSVLAIPMWHKLTAARRSHYQTVEIRVADAPRRDEIVIVVAAASGPRPHARIGDRTTDKKVDVGL